MAPGLKKFEILKHTADLKIKVFGKNREELFKNALFGMSKCQRAETLPEKTKRKIRLKSSDLSALLVDFLSEALYLSQVHKEVYFNVEFEKFSEIELEGNLTGQKVKRFGEDIKGVTYHNLDIHQREDGTWQATVLYDI